MHDIVICSKGRVFPPLRGSIGHDKSYKWENLRFLSSVSHPPAAKKRNEIVNFLPRCILHCSSIPVFVPLIPLKRDVCRGQYSMMILASNGYRLASFLSPQIRSIHRDMIFMISASSWAQSSAEQQSPDSRTNRNCKSYVISHHFRWYQLCGESGSCVLMLFFRMWRNCKQRTRWTSAFQIRSDLLLISNQSRISGLQIEYETWSLVRNRKCGFSRWFLNHPHCAGEENLNL